MRLKDVLFRVAHWETWDWRLKYVPLIPAWLWYGLRSGSFWFFTPSNPGLIFGGYDGVSKKDMYSHLPANSYPRSIYISHKLPFAEVEGLFSSNGYNYPFIAKPETGRMGFMFRKIDRIDDLKLYHENMPADYIIQDYIDYPLEVSVFYYRFSNQQSGKITGFLKKEFLEIKGDGISTLWDLILNYPRVRFRLEEMRLKHKDKLNYVLPEGERFCLSLALNLSRGGKLVNLEHEKDERLLKVFDDLSHHAKHFYYGRYDIKCASVEELKEGKSFSILEFNGSGGEPHHVYGNGNSLLKACWILLQHWDILYKISKHNHKQGIPYWKFKEGWRFFIAANNHVTSLKKADSKLPAS